MAANGEIGPWTIQDLRRSVGSGLAKCGVSRFIIACVLNHADSTVTGIYDRHEYLAEKREALEKWSTRSCSIGPTGNRFARTWFQRSSKAEAGL
jgi:hypothetical protein